MQVRIRHGIAWKEHMVIGKYKVAGDSHFDSYFIFACLTTSERNRILVEILQYAKIGWGIAVNGKMI